MSSTTTQPFHVIAAEFDEPTVFYPVSAIAGAPDLQRMALYGFTFDLTAFNERGGLLKHLYGGGYHLAVRNLSEAELKSLSVIESDYVNRQQPLSEIPFDESKGYYCAKCYAVLKKHFPTIPEEVRREICSVDIDPVRWEEHCTNGLRPLRESMEERFIGSIETEITVAIAIYDSLYIA